MFQSANTHDQLSLEEESGLCMSGASFWKSTEPVYRERLALSTLSWTQQLAYTRVQLD